MNHRGGRKVPGEDVASLQAIGAPATNHHLLLKPAVRRGGTQRQLAAGNGTSMALLGPAQLASKAG